MIQNCPPKPWLSIEQQILTMRSRGLIINASPQTVNALRHFAYYRLSGYSYVLRETDEKTGEKLNSFKPGASFEYIVELYQYDKNLRLLVLDALEKIEISLRASVAYLIGKQNPLFYKDKNYFREEFWDKRYPEWIKKQEKKLKTSDEDCISHNRKKYGENIPVWVICQSWDFGQLVWLLQMLDLNNLEVICRGYGFGGYQSFLTWIKCFNELRNICAHHSRLWNRRFSFAPKKPTGKDFRAPIRWSAFFDQKERRTLFFRVCGIIHFLNFLETGSAWEDRFKNYIKMFPEAPTLGVTLSDLGFTEGWKENIERIKNDLPRTSQVTNHSD